MSSSLAQSFRKRAAAAQSLRQTRERPVAMPGQIDDVDSAMAR
jgi:hypothetical protein